MNIAKSRKGRYCMGRFVPLTDDFRRRLLAYSRDSGITGAAFASQFVPDRNGVRPSSGLMYNLITKADQDCIGAETLANAERIMRDYWGQHGVEQQLPLTTVSEAKTSLSDAGFVSSETKRDGCYTEDELLTFATILGQIESMPTQKAQGFVRMLSARIAP